MDRKDDHTTADRKPVQEKNENKFKQELIEWLKILVSAAVLALGINTFLISNSRIPSPSMEQTIMTGDRVIGSRLAYRFGEPQRGDIAVFRYPDNEKKRYVKRIIGMPGDVVDIRDGKVYLNGADTPLEEPYLPEAMEPEAPMHFEVPEGCYFMLGDNRNRSDDARYWKNTFVKEEKLIAKVLFRYYPNISKVE